MQKNTDPRVATPATFATTSKLVALKTLLPHGKMPLLLVLPDNPAVFRQDSEQPFGDSHFAKPVRSKSLDMTHRPALRRLLKPLQEPSGVGKLRVEHVAVFQPERFVEIPTGKRNTPRHRLSGHIRRVRVGEDR